MVDTSVLDKSIRSVFVGNIPYETTEEKLKDIFSAVGPVLSFKLVFDRENGKPKGYGFCEYKDQETAQSAMRNLNGYEIAGRSLRVDTACTEKSRLEMQSLMAGPPVDNTYGESVDSDKAPEAISKAVASLPPEQMFELMKQMKLCIQNNPEEGRQMLLQNPQLAYALLQAQVVMRIVDPQTAITMLHKVNPAVNSCPPPNITSVQPPPVAQQSVPPPVMMPPVSTMPPPPVSMASAPYQVPTVPSQLPPKPMDQGLPPSQPRMPGPMPPGIAAPPPLMQPPPGQDLDLRTMNRLPPPPPRGAMAQNPMGPGGPLLGTVGPAGPLGPPAPPLSADQDMRIPPSVLPSSIVDLARDPRGMYPRDPRGSMVKPGVPIVGTNMSVAPPVVSSGGPKPVFPAAASAVAAAAVPGGAAASDQEKAALIMQVLQLSDDQIAMLPPEQRQSIIVLKEQIAKSTQQR